MSRRLNPLVDSSEKEQQNLDALLRQRRPQAPTPKDTLQQARFGQALTSSETSVRDKVRILFISRDESLLNQASQSLDGYLQLSDVFDEVHIVILRTGIKAKTPVLRVATNAWLYIAASPSWWQSPLAGYDIIVSQLVFAEGFRPDLIVAHDPFESGWLAKRLAAEYGRPWQVHVLDDMWDKKFTKTDTHPFLRRWLARFVLGAAQSVRTASDAITTVVTKRFSVVDIATLPRLNNAVLTPASDIVYNIKQQYPEYVLTILHVSESFDDAYRVLQSTRDVLRNPRFGICFHTIPRVKRDLEKIVKTLQLERQVVIETDEAKQLDYIRTADIVIISDLTARGDDYTVLAAVAKRAMIVTATTFRKDIFIADYSIRFYEPDDIDALIFHIRLLANDFLNRQTQGEAAYAVVHERLHQDPRQYQREYRASIERAMFAAELAETVTT